MRGPLERVEMIVNKYAHCLPWSCQRLLLMKYSTMMSITILPSRLFIEAELVFNRWKLTFLLRHNSEVCSPPAARNQMVHPLCESIWFFNFRVLYITVDLVDCCLSFKVIRISKRKNKTILCVVERNQTIQATIANEWAHAQYKPSVLTREYSYWYSFETFGSTRKTFLNLKLATKGINAFVESVKMVRQCFVYVRCEFYANLVPLYIMKYFHM